MTRQDIACVTLSLSVAALAAGYGRSHRAAFVVLAASCGLILSATLRAGTQLAPAGCYLPSGMSLGDFAIDVGQNVLLFVPFGVAIAALRSERLFRTSLGAGLLVSVLVELLQALDGTRCASPFDVVANSVGAVMGAVAASQLIRSLNVDASRFHHSSSASIHFEVAQACELDAANLDERREVSCLATAAIALPALGLLVGGVFGAVGCILGVILGSALGLPVGIAALLRLNSSHNRGRKGKGLSLAAIGVGILVGWLPVTFVLCEGGWD